ncbi:hypothetical protein IT41_16850 [Paracoccus halophilus]|uniref:Uncharacterized protein n=1 Tax=Paracoccus halophilus TaxID=376733 RepID=A0A099EXD3_9RHOB|nr:hypothetical protein IT41_16850 [Paracoccus halophilus]
MRVRVRETVDESGILGHFWRWLSVPKSGTSQFKPITGLHHLSVFLIHRAEDRLAVIGMRSLAGALWHALCETLTRQGAA